MFLGSCCRQRTFNDFDSVIFGLYSGDRFEMVAGPGQFCNRFLLVLVLSFSFSFSSFSFYKSVFNMFFVSVLLFPRLVFDI